MLAQTLGRVAEELRLPASYRTVAVLVPGAEARASPPPAENRHHAPPVVRVAAQKVSRMRPFSALPARQ